MKRTDFSIVCDEFFEEILGRWRSTGADRAEALVADRGGEYEIRINMGSADPHLIEVEASGHALEVRTAPAGDSSTRRIFTMPAEIDCEAVSATWSNGVLVVILPKKAGRRIAIDWN